jgi:hypothetical protein
MPYIRPELRGKYNVIIDRLPEITSKGELEYCIFTLMKKYMSTRISRYTELHDCVYAIQHCADEFRRRFLDKREDKAIIENGDIE